MNAPTPSALTTLVSKSSSDPISALTTQVVHNLQHQHLWTSLRIHTSAADFITLSDFQNLPSTATPTPLISGIPPHLAYSHPDEQLYMLELGLRDDDLEPERVFVLATTQAQSWTLRKLAAVFDGLPQPGTVETPPPPDDTTTANGQQHVEDVKSDGGKAAKLARYYERRREAMVSKEWGGKRLLLAVVDRTMGGDGTVVYYVVQEGNVKPRQN
jgi:tRNA-splicing endonuclease subunit Sen15